MNMQTSFVSSNAVRGHRFLWVDLTQGASASLVDSLDGTFDVHRVREPMHVGHAIETHTPQFLCFEFDEPDAQGIDALNRIGNEHPSLPILVITGRSSAAAAMWSLRLPVWDLLIKPVQPGELGPGILALASPTRPNRPASIGHSHGMGAVVASESCAHENGKQGRTHPAIRYAVEHFDHEIALGHVAALCQLGRSQFCRAFRLEHGVSFGQYLLRLRMDRACDRLGDPDALVKEVAYSVGFNDLSYFTRAFRRQMGVCPSAYQAAARSSYWLSQSS
jgi:two-component system response regulator YesN